MVSRSRLYTKPLGPRRATGAQDRGPERRTSTLVITPPAGVKGVTRAGTPFVVLHLQILQTQAKSIRAACLVVVCSPRRSSRHLPPLLQAFLRPAHSFGARTRTPPNSFLCWFFSSSHAMTHQAGPARAFTQSRPLSQTHHAMVAPRPSLHVPPLHLRSRCGCTVPVSRHTQ